MNCYIIYIGRWTKEEHNLFVKALELHGKSWKLIQKTVKTRSIVQIRTHSQKYFLKIDKTKQSVEEQRRKEHKKVILLLLICISLLI